MQVQGSSIAGATGQNVAVTGASSGQAQGNSASGQTAGQVSQPAGGGATGTVPGAPAVGSIVTTQPNLQLPTASLFKTHPEGNAGFLVETDPRFTEYKQWCPTTIKFVRSDPSLPRPDSIIVKYTIDGETTTVKFPNEANQIPEVMKP